MGLVGGLPAPLGVRPFIWGDSRGSWEEDVMYGAQQEAERTRVPVTHDVRGFDALNWGLSSDVGNTNRAAGGGSTRSSSGRFDQSAFKSSHELQNSGHSPAFWNQPPTLTPDPSWMWTPRPSEPKHACTSASAKRKLDLAPQ